ncbi:hypothetical protein SBA2_310013 [Acidobacteriia bacterium SbA2]|nr:hypothetical protein SBA2_310013 [Acidobacteriia bacterium SbA2]
MPLDHSNVTTPLVFLPPPQSDKLPWLARTRYRLTDDHPWLRAALLWYRQSHKTRDTALLATSSRPGMLAVAWGEAYGRSQSRLIPQIA